MFNLSDLIVFIEAAEANNFSEAGRRLHLSQPAISQKIDNLQKHFNTKLFERHGREMRLTEAGQVLKPMAKELLGVAKRIEETMVSLQEHVFGEMVIGCSTASGKYLLPSLIAAFREEYPHVRIHVSVSSRRSVIERVINGDYNFAVSSKVVEHRDLVYKPLFQDNIILIVPPNHPWAKYPTIQPDDLLDQPLILREDGAGTREVLLQGLAKHGITPDMLNIAMELGNAEAIVMAVEENIGIAFISHLAAMRSLNLGNVVKVNVKGLELHRTISIAQNERYPATRAQQEFWEFLDGPIAKRVLYSKREEITPIPA